MNGVIACPVTDAVRNKYKKDFKLLSLPTNCSSGYIYLRGSNPIGVAMTRSYGGDDTYKWICRPEIADSAVSALGLSRDDLLAKMIDDSCYGTECQGTAIKLTGKNDELYELVTNADRFAFQDSPDGGIIGKTPVKDPNITVRDESGDVIPEECIMQNVTDMWSLDVIDPHPISGIMKYAEKFMVDERSNIMAIYKFAKDKGKYTSLRSAKVYAMSRIVETYEEYFNDLTKFIDAKFDDPSSGSTDAAAAAIKAIDIDDNFYKNLFSDEYDIRDESFESAVMQILEAFIIFTNFLCTVNDNFISILNKCNNKKTTPSDLALINVYGFSVTRFIKRYAQELFGVQYPLLVKIKDGDISTDEAAGEKTKANYVLW